MDVMDSETQKNIIVKLKDFLINAWDVSRKFLPEDIYATESPCAALEDEINLECMTKFIGESHEHLFIQRNSPKDDVEETMTTHNIRNNIDYTTTKMSGLLLLKWEAGLTSDKSIESQVRVLNFKELDLLHFQQDIPIPECPFSRLPPHPKIVGMIKQCSVEGRIPNLADFEEQLKDVNFLNTLDNCVNRWVKYIKGITKLEKDPFAGTALKEINFWLNFEGALKRIQEKSSWLGVVLTIEILKNAKRLNSTVSFETDTGLKEALARTTSYNLLMQNIPIHELLSTTDLKGITAFVQLTFPYLRKRAASKHLFQRYLDLVDAICKEVNAQLIKVLRGRARSLLDIPHREFEEMMMQCFELFSIWEDEYDMFERTLRRIIRTEREDPIIGMLMVLIENRKIQIEKRIEQIQKLRQQHIVLYIHINLAFRLSIQCLENLTTDMNVAYDGVKEVDSLDISKDGQDAWDAAVHCYEERIIEVEAKIIVQLRDQLERATHPNEMFRICSRFNALFIRPQVRSAIKDHQKYLLQRVQEDINALQLKIKMQYPDSKSARMSNIRDLPPVAGLLIWMRQINNKLTTYLGRMKDVLGPEWENYAEGEKIRDYANNIRAKLKTDAIFQDFIKEVYESKGYKDKELSSSIFIIEEIQEIRSNSKEGNGTVMKLMVNFMPEDIVLSKESRNMRVHGFRLPPPIINMVHGMNMLIPYRISLIDSIETYTETLQKLEDNSFLNSLTAGMHKQVQSLIAEGLTLTWENYKLEVYTQRVFEMIMKFEKRVDELIIIGKRLKVCLCSLETCPYSFETFADILEKIQQAIDDLSFNQYTNIYNCVACINNSVEKILAVRLQAGIQAWTYALNGNIGNIQEEDTTNAQSTHKLGGDPKIKTIVHEVCIINKTICLFPSIEEARLDIMQQMFAWQAIVTSQHRLQSTSYKVGLDKHGDESFRNILSRLPGGTKPLEDAYLGISNVISAIESYLSQWLRYQALWDLQYDNLYGILGDDFCKWMQCLNDIEKTLAALPFITSDTTIIFGPVVTHSAEIQGEVFSKYDSWRKEIRSKVKSLMKNEITTSKTNTIPNQSQVANNQQQILPEAKAVENGSKAFEDATLVQLQLFESKFARLLEEASVRNKSKGMFTKMQNAFEELQELRGVKAKLDKIRTEVNETMLSEQPCQLRQQLGAMTALLKKLPGRLPQYAPDDYVKELLETYAQVNTMIIELKYGGNKKE